MATASTDDPGEDEPGDPDEPDADLDDGFTCGNCRRGRCAQCKDRSCGCCAGGDPEPWPPRW